MKENYKWINYIPPGWATLARNMIERCEQLDPTYHIIDMKEKWGTLRTISTCENNYDIISDIENSCEQLSQYICCQCGTNAVKYSTGYILPWCDECGKDDEKYYKRFK